jgi:CheY-like chemotaxis protein
LARNGCEAYDAIKKNGIDVVLLDAMMPVMDGLTVCRMVKRDEKTRDLPIIMMSASLRLCEEARNNCADAVISKPFDIDYLVSMVNHYAQA